MLKISGLVNYLWGLLWLCYLYCVYELNVVVFVFVCGVEVMGIDWMLMLFVMLFVLCGCVYLCVYCGFCIVGCVINVK